MAIAILYDSTACIGCRECESACSERWKLPYNDKIAAEEKTSARKLTTIRTHGERFSRKLCMHCMDPACVSVCPVGALEKTRNGPVVYDEGKCMGCRYCMVACPFEVPSYEWNAFIPKVRKCDLCADLTAKGGKSRCTEVCPVEATLTGDRAEMIAEARRRMAESPEKYYPKIYGLTEAGGTSVLILSAVPFEQLGYPANLPQRKLPEYTWAVLQHIPDITAVGAVFLGGVYWITHRRERVAAEEGGR